MTTDGGSFLTSVDAVLQDAAALKVFQEWISLNSPNSTDCLALHFAIKGYQAYLSQKEPSTSSMACTLHRKFISQRTGTCSFLPSLVRSEMSTRVHSLNSHQLPYPELFEPVQPALRKHLNALHSKFIASPNFAAFLTQRTNEGSSSATPMDEIHLLTCPHFTAASTLTREFSKKIKISKTHAYSCNPSTSRYTNEGRRDIEVDRERHLYKHPDGSIRHDLPEAREAFASVLTERLEVISKELERCDENTFARDLPRDLAACSLLPSLHDNRILEDTTSDEEVEKYVGKIDGTRRRSESISPMLMNFHPTKANPYENGFAPPPQEIPLNVFNMPTSSTFPISNKSLEYRLSDSSGFCSSESAYFSSKKFGRKKNSFHSHQIGSSSLARRQYPPIFAQSSVCTLQSGEPSLPLTLVLREDGQPRDGGEDSIRNNHARQISSNVWCFTKRE
ncbi:Axl-1p [Parelaphostrongylus tenuis]|uniref:Axl-1p n=1 Tax=Parelaphostrongylus tenuis TaxID=148309 RepID=A0AAD5N7D1_PARTN|nr:Axl-1p [Parelaphostrongylus tenuis]